jgi:hypothetical protein
VALNTLNTQQGVRESSSVMSPGLPRTCTGHLLFLLTSFILLGMALLAFVRNWCCQDVKAIALLVSISARLPIDISQVLKPEN